MDLCLTDRSYWENYWSNYQFKVIPDRVFFYKELIRLKGAKSFIEIGGFPGEIATLFYKQICQNVTILDYYIDQSIINKVEEINGLQPNVIKCIETDFFNYRGNITYDIVFSYGFVEHFADTEDVLKKHVQLISTGGRLLVLIPNFRGLNGLIQYCFDKETYNVHNLNSMDIVKLKTILKTFGLKNIEVKFSKTPMIWLEPKPSNSKFLRSIIKTFSLALKIFPFPGRLLSPYIIIYAEK